MTITTEQQQFWCNIQSEYALNMTIYQYQRTVGQMSLLSLTDSMCVIGVQDARQIPWIENRMANNLSRTLSSALGRRVDVEFVAADEAVEA